MPSISAPATLAIAGAAATATGDIIGGFAQQKALSYQSQVAANNATIAGQKAQYATEAGSAEAEAQGLKGAQQQGRLRTSIAANNLDVNSGSAADVQVSQREANQLSTENVTHQSALAAYGYQTQETNDLAQAKLLHDESDLAPIQGGISAVSAFAGSPSAQNWFGASTTSTPKGSNQSFAPGATAAPTPIVSSSLFVPSPSLTSGDPEIPGAYQWMAANGGGELY